MKAFGFALAKAPIFRPFPTVLADKVGREYFAPHIDSAIDLATEIAEEAEMREM